MRKLAKGGEIMSGVRWTVCALIFFATTVNYLDRQLYSVLVPFFVDDLRLGPTDLALISVSFLLPYGLVMLFTGIWIDKVGVRKGLSIAFLLWNIASIGHGFVRNLGTFLSMRTLLGVGESAMFPSAVKTMTDWFPRKERSLATGIFNGGASFGAILAPILGVFIANRFGWRACFLITGSVGIIWIFFWRIVYRDPDQNSKITASELEYIRSDGESSEKPMTVRQLFGMRPVYGLAIAKALSDAPLWFYMTWMPTFLVDQFHLSTTFMAFAIPVIYLVSDVGSVAGGWASSSMIRAGKPVGYARKLTMLICALMVVPVMTVGLMVDHAPLLGIPCVYWAVAIVSIAAGAHQGWSCNLFTMISDTVPPGSTARAVGAINGFAMVGASAMQLFTGKAVQITSSYTLPFIVAGSLYLIALVVIQLFIPRVYQHATDRKANIPWCVVGTFAFIAALSYMIYDTNRPPYGSVTQYQTARAAELHATGDKLGPEAQVGWMHGTWHRWTLPDGTFKYDLVKLDSEQRPTIEKKGTKAPHYIGPSMDQMKAEFSP